MEEAVGVLREAVRRDGGLVEGWMLLGGGLAELGWYEEAVGAMEGVLRLRPGYVPALVNLGAGLRQLGRLEEAEKVYREAVGREEGAGNFEGWLGLGVVLRGRTKFAEALEVLGRAVGIAPGRGEGHLEAGEILAEMGRYGEAVVELGLAIERLDGGVGSAEALVALGAGLHQLGRSEEALGALKRAEELRPEMPEVHYNLGVVEGALRGAYAAIGHYRRAIELRGDYAAAHLNLSDALRMSGQGAAGLPHARRAVELWPGNSLIHSAVLYAMHYVDETTRETLLAEHRRWAERHVVPLLAGAGGGAVGHENGAEAGRRLRLGYVSPDFRDHALARYVLPILENQDHEAFEVFLYSSVMRSDAVTARVKATADHWREVGGLSDEALAEVIRGDRIDVLVDLSQHMAGNRMMTFARRPAPVQVAAFGYPSTTGSPAIDVRLSDWHVEPEGWELAGPERIARMPESYWCFSPHDDAAEGRSERMPVPALVNGYVTLGSLNNPAKTTKTAIGNWAAVLRAVPGSRLVLGSGLPGDGPVVAEFVAEGIDPARIEFLPKARRGEYLEFYRRIDIGIDPYPYVGHSTSCDAFWMGVPVLTMAGGMGGVGGEKALPVSRAGASLLKVLGLPELVAETREGLVKNAVEMAGDMGRLRELAYGMRERMVRSPLMDAVAYTRALEGIYREAWVRWCARTK